MVPGGSCSPRGRNKTKEDYKDIKKKKKPQGEITAKKRKKMRNEMASRKKREKLDQKGKVFREKRFGERKTFQAGMEILPGSSKKLTWVFARKKGHGWKKPGKYTLIPLDPGEREKTSEKNRRRLRIREKKKNPLGKKKKKRITPVMPPTEYTLGERKTGNPRKAE